MNRLRNIQLHKQAIWLDFLSRRFIENGDLERLVQADGLTGVTSNPAIFEKAIAGTQEYDESVTQMLRARDQSVTELYESLAVADIQNAATLLRSVYDATNGADGFVSLEVSPYLAMDTAGTIAEGRRLWNMVGRDNAMIKVPATSPGLPAIEALIADGININITLLFSRQVYRQVAHAYISGLEAYANKGGDLSKVSSVASFFVSRIDTAVEKLIDDKIARVADPKEKQALEELKGKVAIANAKLAYRDYKDIFGTERWNKLASKGAKPQRLLWASTGTKNKAYSDVLYVEELIGPNTVNTIPLATLNAFRDHGAASNTLEAGLEKAAHMMSELQRFDISMDAIADHLVEDGVKLFVDAADSLLEAVAQKRKAVRDTQINDQRLALPKELEQRVKSLIDDWRKGGKVRRLWRGDASLWTGTDEAQWLGWLNSVESSLADIERWQSFAAEVKAQGFTHVVLLGMGGSSLAPAVLAATLGTPSGWPKLLVLDSTDPAEIRAVEASVDIGNTLFIVASKSGSTLEPNILMAHFIDRVAQAVTREKAGRHFAAITDPNSQLAAVAKSERFRWIFFGEPSIGGRYSVMSPFGLVPAAATGLDVKHFLIAAQAMVRSCAADAPPSQNPGVELGIAMGVAGMMGRDKVTVLTSPALATFGAWLEQLIAESTGKDGKGLLPVEAEPLGSPGCYGSDRLFIVLRVSGDGHVPEKELAALEKAGHPVVRITMPSAIQLGQEFFRFEIATAVAGSILGINPFNQPDVEASKIKTREITQQFERDGALPVQQPTASDDILEIYTDERNAQELRKIGARESVESWLNAHLSRIEPGDYVAFLAYVERNTAHERLLNAARVTLRDARRIATSVGFGPRFLHSTGQAHKGGPNSGVFLQITADDGIDLPIARRSISFGTIKAAQASADFDVLVARRRRAMRVHLKGNASYGLERLNDAIKRALA